MTDWRVHLSEEGPAKDLNNFQGRRPIVVKPDVQHIYIGKPNGFHAQVYRDFDINDSWEDYQGFARGGKDWSSGALSWYGDTPIEHDEILDAIEPFLPGTKEATPPADPWKFDQEHMSQRIRPCPNCQTGQLDAQSRCMDCGYQTSGWETHKNDTQNSVMDDPISDPTDEMHPGIQAKTASLREQWHGAYPGIWRGDHSMIYEPETNTLHIGSPEFHHADIVDALTGDWHDKKDSQRFPAAAVMPTALGVEYYWYGDEGAPHAQAVYDHLQSQYPSDIQWRGGRLPDWKFASDVNDLLADTSQEQTPAHLVDKPYGNKGETPPGFPPYEPGKLGKGFVWPNGRVVSWGCNEEGHPHHAEGYSIYGEENGLHADIVHWADGDTTVWRQGPFASRQAVLDALQAHAPEGDDWTFSKVSAPTHRLNYKAIPLPEDQIEPDSDEKFEPGRGIVLNDGSVHTWTCPYWDPTHMQYLDQHDIDLGNVRSFLYIEPQGYASQAGGGAEPGDVELMAKLQGVPTHDEWKAQQPAKPDLDDWSFSAASQAASQNGSHSYTRGWKLTDSAKKRFVQPSEDQLELFPRLKFIEGQKTVDHTTFNGRRPILYSPSQRSVWLGQPDLMHSQLRREFELGMGGDYHQGFIGSGDNSYGAGDLGWYGAPSPEEHDEIRELLKPYLRADILEQEPDWRFGSEQQHMLNWEPGTSGRGIVEPDGTMHTWSDGTKPLGSVRPVWTHWQYIRQLQMKRGLPVEPPVRSFMYLYHNGEVEDAGAHPEDVQAMADAIGGQAAKSSWNFTGNTSAQQMMYHVAPTSAREQIAQQGLRTDQESMWPEMESQPQGAYVWDDRDRAVNWAYHAHSLTDEPHDVWRVNTEGLEPKEDYLMTANMDWPGSYYFEQPLGPERLTHEHTVGEDDWSPGRVSKTAANHQLNWEPGNEGKGIVYDGDVHTWNTNTQRGNPHHYEYLMNKGLDSSMGGRWAFFISPEGKYVFPDYWVEDKEDQAIKRERPKVNKLIQGVAGLEPVDQMPRPVNMMESEDYFNPDWKFSSEYDIAPYDEDQPGKAFVANGQVYAWRTNGVDPAHTFGLDHFGVEPNQASSFHVVHPEHGVSQVNPPPEQRDETGLVGQALNKPVAQQDWDSGFGGGYFDDLIDNYRKTSQAPITQKYHPGGSDWDANRIPLVFDTQDRVLHTSNPGAYHSDILLDEPSQWTVDGGEGDERYRTGQMIQGSGKPWLEFWEPLDRPEDYEEIGKLLGAKPAVDDKDHPWNFSKTAGMTFYHVAPTTERARIQTHGLQPSNPQWAQHWGEDAKYMHQPTGVYLFDLNAGDPNRSLDDLAYLQRLHNNSDVWGVNLPWEQAAKLPTDPAWEGAVYSQEPISPEHLELLEGPEHRSAAWDFAEEKARAAPPWTPGSWGKASVYGDNEVDHWKTDVAPDGNAPGLPYHQDRAWGPAWQSLDYWIRPNGDAYHYQNLHGDYPVDPRAIERLVPGTRMMGTIGGDYPEHEAQRPQEKLWRDSSWHWSASNGLEFSLEPVPKGHGADDYESDEGDAYTLHAHRQGTPVGYIDYNLIPEDQRVHIRWVQTHPEYQRQGVASQMMDELERRYPERDNWHMETSGFTPEGDDFWHQRYSALDHQLNWTPGKNGKGLMLDDGSVHAWNSRDWQTHYDYLEHALGWTMPPRRDAVRNYYTIGLNGEVSNAGGPGAQEDHDYFAKTIGGQPEVEQEDDNWEWNPHRPADRVIASGQPNASYPDAHLPAYHPSTTQHTGPSRARIAHSVRTRLASFTSEVLGLHSLAKRISSTDSLHNKPALLTNYPSSQRALTSETGISNTLNHRGRYQHTHKPAWSFTSERPDAHKCENPKHNAWSMGPMIARQKTRSSQDSDATDVAETPSYDPNQRVYHERYGLGTVVPESNLYRRPDYKTQVKWDSAWVDTLFTDGQASQKLHPVVNCPNCGKEFGQLGNSYLCPDCEQQYISKHAIGVADPAGEHLPVPRQTMHYIGPFIRGQSSQGKGLTTHDGEHYSWATDGLYPQHQDVLDALGKSDRSVLGYYNISRQGEVDYDRNTFSPGHPDTQRGYKSFVDSHPDLVNVMTEPSQSQEWRFASDISKHAAGDTIRELDHPPDEDSNFVHGERRPVIAYQDAGEIHIGEPGTYHGDIEPYDPSGGASRSAWIREGQKGPELNWYKDYGDHLEDQEWDGIHKALENYIPGLQLPYDDWRFGASEPQGDIDAIHEHMRQNGLNLQPPENGNGKYVEWNGGRLEWGPDSRKDSLRSGGDPVHHFDVINQLFGLGRPLPSDAYQGMGFTDIPGHLPRDPAQYVPGWKFGGAEPQGDWRLVDVGGSGQDTHDENYPPPYGNLTYPVLAVPREKVVYQGGPGQYHYNMKIPDKNGIWFGGNYRGRLTDQNVITWWDEHPSFNSSEVEKQFGWEHEPERWTFSKVGAESQEPAVPGEPPSETPDWTIAMPRALTVNGVHHIWNDGRNHMNYAVEKKIPFGDITDFWMGRGDQWQNLSYARNEYKNLYDKAWAFEASADSTAPVKEYDYPLDDQAAEGYPSVERRPVIYDRETGGIHVGPYGSHHKYLMEAAGLPGSRFGPGAATRYNFGVLDDEGFDPFSGDDDENELIRRSLGDMPYYDPNWNFSHVANYAPEGEWHDWEPGYWGKGYRTPEGDVRTWQMWDNVEPIHYDVLGENSEDYDNVFEHGVTFQIDPQGRAIAWRQPGDTGEFDHALKQHHPALSYDPEFEAGGIPGETKPEDWRLSASGLKTVEIQPDARPAMSTYDEYGERKPLIYDEPNHTLYIGPENYTHYQITDAAAKQGYNPTATVGEGLHQGWIGPNPEKFRGHGTEDYGWYQVPRWQAEQEIAQHLGVDPIDREAAGLGWTFSRVGGPVSVVNYAAGRAEMTRGNAYEWRKPVHYFPQSNTAFVGDWGDYHGDLPLHHPCRKGPYHTGFIANPEHPEAHGQGGLGFFEDYPENAQEIAQAIGVPLADFEGDRSENSWGFRLGSLA